MTDKPKKSGRRKKSEFEKKCMVWWKESKAYQEYRQTYKGTRHLYEDEYEYGEALLEQIEAFLGERLDRGDGEWGVVMPFKLRDGEKQ
ncbi:MAG: hypothetical protein M1483_02775 [Actinobacteria bacterium]|nr:hypothetical protein [Actinomycetota bacterium]MCL6104549.1 hypothetical protein [Actinomycetota bacterium]